MLVYFKSGYDRLIDRFPGRAIEWQNAMILSTIGWVLTIRQDPALFDVAYFAPMRAMAEQWVWAYAAFGIGIVRVTFLFINGTMPRTSSYLRVFSAFASCFFWFTILYGLAGNQFVSLGMAAYSWLLLGDFYSIHRASTDARLADNKARENKGHGKLAHGTLA